MCDISNGGRGLQRNIQMTFLVNKIDMRGFPKAKSPGSNVSFKWRELPQIANKTQDIF
jgi:hypothetical protein